MLITLARKPLAKETVAQTCLSYGSGAMNIDASRIATTDDFSNVQGFASMKLNARRQGENEDEWKVRVRSGPEQQAALAKLKSLGRWPSNVILTGAVNMAAFPDTGGGSFQRGGPPRSGSPHFDQISNRPRTNAIMNHGDQGSAARYFKQIRLGPADDPVR